MGNNIPLAREEEGGRSLLLAYSSSGQVRYYSSCRDPREEENPPIQAEETPEVISPKKESKSTAKVKSGDGRRGKRRGQYYTSGESVREIEGGNITTRRTAKELGITWSEDRCEESSSTKAHHFVATTAIAKGDIYECKYCHKVKWLPRTMDGVIQFSNLILICGVDIAYQKMLDKHPIVRNLIAKIQDFYILRKSLPSDSLAKVIAAIMSDEEYPYEVDIVEEEVP